MVQLSFSIIRKCLTTDVREGLPTVRQVLPTDCPPNSGKIDKDGLIWIEMCLQNRTGYEELTPVVARLWRDKDTDG